MTIPGAKRARGEEGKSRGWRGDEQRGVLGTSANSSLISFLGFINFFELLGYAPYVLCFDTL